MKKQVILFDNPRMQSETEFLKVDTVVCPLCRQEKLWRDVTLTPIETGITSEVSIEHYACGHCGIFFYLTIIDPDMKEAHNRTNQNRFRAATVT